MPDFLRRLAFFFILKGKVGAEAQGHLRQQAVLRALIHLSVLGT